MTTAPFVAGDRLGRLARAAVPGKAVLLYGPRQVGKTTLLRHFVREHRPDALFVSGADLLAKEAIESQSVATLSTFVGRARTLIVDDAQQLRRAGLNLKLFVDHLPGLSVVAAASCALDLGVEKGDPLTGRKRTLFLHPVSQWELSAVESPAETRAQLETRLIYGSYPEIVRLDSNEKRRRCLRELASTRLDRDLLRIDSVRRPDRLLPLLRLLARRMGSELSLSELGAAVGLGRNTVDRYLWLVQEAFLVYARFARCPEGRHRVGHGLRIHFHDNGVRNALISNFEPLSLRGDAEVLWQNYILGERLKRNDYAGHLADSTFWRTGRGREPDLIEESNGSLSAIRSRWSPRPADRVPASLRRAFPDASFRVIHRDNYLDFIADRPPATGPRPPRPSRRRQRTNGAAPPPGRFRPGAARPGRLGSGGDGPPSLNYAEVETPE